MIRFRSIKTRTAIAIGTLWLACGCSPVKHVPKGKYLLDNTEIVITQTPDTTAGRRSDETVRSSDLVNYLRQTPNHKVLGFLKLQLATYSLSGKDSTHWYNRWLRRLGQPPVIYNSDLTEASRRQLRLALVNRGFMQASVEVDTMPNSARRRMDVSYLVNTGPRHRISRMDYDIADTAIARIVRADSALLTLRAGEPFDRDRLDEERSLVTRRLRDHGYYAFAKDYISYIADTAENSLDVDLTMVIRPPMTPGISTEGNAPSGEEAISIPHLTYRVRSVWFITDYAPNSDRTWQRDTVSRGDIHVVYGRDRYIRPSTLEEKCFIEPGQLYSSRDVDMTYQSLAQLGILRSINIEMQPVSAPVDGRQWIDAYVYLTRNKKQGATLELEGTNSEGDLGFGIGATYQHRDVGRASNLFTAQFRMNYESLSGNLSGLINNRYTEYAGEAGLTFPRFLFPFLSGEYKRRIKATTELAVSMNYQERPEYTRIIAGAAWKYKWSARAGRERRTFDLVDVNYVYLPESTIDFINQIAPSNPLLRYSYEDHFIMRSGYTFYRTNRRIASATSRRQPVQPTVYSLRASGEVAGNLLYALSSLTHEKKHNGVYRLFGIQYSQYAKAEVDYSIARNFAYRHSVAFHVGAGIGVPYGNSRVLPFEKRFYAGGANGVRGWGVRTLGPGSYDSRNSVTDFINQCGDISLLLNVEYRMKLFWVFEGALFADAGNIWTIHNYENQRGGMFHFSTFWKQIAASYGVGLRMDFSYFLLRFDLGMKAHDPAADREHWPIIHPRWGRDATFHFSVGYPF
ncbi:BamA/TamA family outer membrane protein [Paramuribaculum intestinale]|uniref:translocation and assembly module lipoprotein TamL n=1 Tax=Paramuribaculum intestinale TaxID=2094151 RepID=UPI0025A97CBC|nr:BamA/TamA family outer membrane protein [Paramuribaculum intestinale]